jgi:hypothetical protein
VSVVVYALFESPAAAAAAETDVGQRHASTTPRLVQQHVTAPIDANILPDSATGYGRNLLLAMAAGAVFMGVAGGIAGGLDLVLGMGVGFGIALGGITGLLMGLVGAMQAGTRVAKPQLLALEDRIRRGAALLVVEADPHESSEVVETLSRHDPIEVDVLGSW